MKKYIKIARPDHWVKNAFILPGVAIAILLTDSIIDGLTFVRLLWGFFATCLIASANYVINEWLDAEFDQYHPTKKFRPVVSKGMKLSLVMAEYIFLIGAGIFCSMQVSIIFMEMEVWLLIMGVLYNVKPLRTKDIPYLDVLSESVNNLIRLLLGWFLVTETYQPPISILIGYWMAGAFLMATKRYAEYRMIGNPEQAGLYRKSFLYYNEKLLLISSFFYGMSATFFIGFFMIKYRIEYLIAMPFLFGLFSMYLYISFKEDSAVQKPEKLYREKKLLCFLFVFIAALIVLTFVDIPILDYYVEIRLIGV